MSEWIVLGFLLLVVLAIGAVVVVIVRATRQRQAANQPPPHVPNSIPAGWYDDGNGTTRWYDGQRWTPHTR